MKNYLLEGAFTSIQMGQGVQKGSFSFVGARLIPTVELLPVMPNADKAPDLLIQHLTYAMIVANGSGYGHKTASNSRLEQQFSCGERTQHKIGIHTLGSNPKFAAVKTNACFPRRSCP